jgi:transposase
MKPDETIISRKFEALSPFLDERARRLWAATEARSLGRGGVAAVHRATGMSKITITAGLKELEGAASKDPSSVIPAGKLRRAGGGRKSIGQQNPKLVEALDALIEPTTRGDPMSPLRWTCKSLRNLAAELRVAGYEVSHETVRDLLSDMGYSLQSNRKTREGEDHPDRDAQFRHINTRCEKSIKAGQPVISVDTKKKELIGDFKNEGREWQPKGEPEKVRTHDFIDETLGKAIPYGVYDIAKNDGWVSVGTDHDTPEFAVATIRRWWHQMGRQAYPDAKSLLITADAGGSNGYRVRLWKSELQRLANETKLKINVCHFPPGTSKWNKIEHRMFCHITQNWRGRPLISEETIVQLIGSTVTSTGLRVRAAIDKGEYPTGIEVSDERMEALNIKRDSFHGDWNYTVSPT